MATRAVGLRLALWSVLCSCAASAFAADQPNAEGSAPEPKGFVELAAQDGMTEVQLGELALRQSQDPQVREFAQRMIEDHGKANTELTGIAQQRNLIVGKRMDATHTALLQHLSTKTGADFDAAYASAMQDAHERAVTLFKRESKASDRELAAFAKKMLPTLTAHKRMADRLSSKIRTTAMSTQTLVSYVPATNADRCEAQLEVELTPDVPNPREPAFLSALAANPLYMLTWVEGSKSRAVLRLTGPATDHRCEQEIMRIARDAHVRNVQVLQ
jgi:putative membrane protein